MVRKLTLIAVALIALAAPRPALAQCDCTSIPTLGSAGIFGAFGIGNPVKLQGSAFAEGTTAVAGNVGTGPAGSIEFQGNAGIDGRAVHHTGTTVTVGPSATVGGGIVERDMTPEVTDLIAASAAFAAMTPTVSYGSLTSSTTMGGNGCINVIEVTGGINLGGKKTITLSGSSDDYFIINIQGDFITGGKAGVVLSGLDAHQVIYNMVTPGALVDMRGTASADGTFLNPHGEVTIIGTAGGTGAYYSGVNTLLFQGNADFFAQPFECGTGSCEDPESSGINIQTPSTPPSRSTGNRPFFYAYFDPTTFAGHLEAFRVAPDGSIKDKLGNAAVDSVTNELVPGRTYYWDAGEELATNGSRVLYTSDVSIVPTGTRTTFDATLATEAAMDLQAGELPAYPNFPASGVVTTAQLRDAIISYLNGRDAFDENGNADTTELRSSVLGDIFRSNPIYIGGPTTLLSHEDGYVDFYNAYAQRDHMVYAGANDGILHAFNAGDYYDPDSPDPSIFDVGDGSERFGYIPAQLVDQIKLVPRTFDGSGERLAPGFVDGNIVAADTWLGDGGGSDVTKSGAEWATVAISAFREGGDGYLALDITNPDAGVGDDHGPYPKLLWEFNEVDLGQSWSRPAIARVKLAGATGVGDNCGRSDGDGDCMEVWVAIFGGGYAVDGDPNDAVNYESNPAHTSWRDVTKSIYIVRLDTGAVLAKVDFDATGTNGPSDMLASMASAPSAVDLDGDQFTDVIYIGSLNGDLWKWDVSNKGVDSDADNVIDNWSYGKFFEAGDALLTIGRRHYRSMFNPPAVAWVDGAVTLVFGTAERNDLLYEGDALVDDQNRIYVVRDENPTGGSAFSSILTEANLVDITSSGTYTPTGTDKGFFIIGNESEKFVADPLIFAGYAIVPSFQPPAFPACGPGDANLYIFDLTDAKGFYDADATFTASDRKIKIGGGIPSNPRISVASNPANDKIFINTSDGQVLTLTPPTRDAPSSEMLYWRQLF